ncbi:methyltransferase domain-containing protein [Winogradskyella bathintestinalis]|uniref:Methyltransferase domain-containing protein n=1 Tax=Winogradskyella bathintestinalis TaxID=3035208 RepID=A0ABT7ZTU5_9FLAO|nr:hypothetical protein [Winogradskyella bathintestinalis]MDN3492423.1 hypothetical protein [Winogradskyella bathintestinalis]
MKRDDYYKNIDRAFRLPRVWSNRELLKFAHLFSGHIANVSGWKDIDKEGKHYKDYFSNANSYSITNYKSEARGFQNFENEIFLDLTETLPTALVNNFDVVFNHTVLEHIYEVHTAFKNLCAMTKDVAIVVVPFLQEMHADYGDFWRFTPLTMDKLFKENGMDMMYCSFNSHKNASVYLFCIATKNKAIWLGVIPESKSYIDPYNDANRQNWVGCHAIENHHKKSSLLKRIFNRINKWLE